MAAENGSASPLKASLEALEKALDADQGGMFWDALLNGILTMSGAEAVGLWQQGRAQPATPGDPSQSTPSPDLRKVRVTGDAKAFDPETDDFLRATAAELNPGDLHHASDGNGGCLIVTPWQPAGPRAGAHAPRLLLGLWVRGDAARQQHAAAVLGLSLHVAERARERREAETSRRQAENLHQALDLMLVIQPERRFVALTMRLVNEIASRFGCDRVSLGLVHHGRLRLRAISHTEKFDAKTEAALAMIAAMEESTDQAVEIQVPAPEGQTAISRDHQSYAKSQGAANLLTLPLFPSGYGVGSALPEEAAQAAESETIDPTSEDDQGVEAVGALTLEREGRPFSEEERATLRIICDQASRMLLDLQRSDRWFGARWAAGVRHGCSKFLGAEHTWWKLLGVMLATALLVLIFGRGDYRVEGDFTVRADRLSHLVSPFDGFLDESLVRPGDAVETGQVLVRLDRRDLLLQRQGTVADIAAHTGAMLRAEATNDLAQMQVERARLEQARAQLDLIDFRLEQSEITAPFDGVIVEGDLEQRIGSPLRQGESILQIARLEDLHLELHVDERDVQELVAGRTGHVAFTSRPRFRFPIEIERVEPAARVDAGGNLFVARANFQSGPEAWWRPGMSGVAKIDAGRRPYWWMVSHRTADFVRLRWWW